MKALAEDKRKIEVLRKRLSNISWFMAAFSEYLARRSNQEDQCTGRFFEGRFQCREVTTEGALLVCGMYVDLNQIRAGEAHTPEQSTRCSVGIRIQARQRKTGKESHLSDHWLAALELDPQQLGDVPSKGEYRAGDKGLLPTHHEPALSS